GTFNSRIISLGHLMSIPSRADIPVEQTWDLSSVFPDAASWLAEKGKLEARFERIGSFRGQLAASAETLAQALELWLDLRRQTERLSMYARHQSDTDTANSANFAMVLQMEALRARVQSASSFLRPEILSIDPERLEQLLADERAEPYRRMVNEWCRYREHTLSHGEERLLSEAGAVLQTAEKVYSQLTNSDLSFGTVHVDGRDIPVTHGTYGSLLKHPSREIRRDVYERYYDGFESHKHSLAALLGSSLETDAFLARTRHFPSALVGALFADNVSPTVYDNLIETAGQHLEPLHEYYTLRKDILELPTQRIYDTYVPIVPPDSAEDIPYEEAVETIVAACAPLGEDYCTVLHHGLTDARWVDRYENQGKRSGAYSGGAYQTLPFILMNYRSDDIRSMFTLAHEAGHSMHRFYSDRTQRYGDHSISIFAAEVASTFNEELLARHLLGSAKAQSPAFRRSIINHRIDDIKATFYRQTMFAEFERATHAAVEGGNPLTLESGRASYRTLLTKYFGNAVTIEDRDELEFLRIPHFFWSFYVYKYATGLAAAHTLVDLALSGSEEHRAAYLGFLSAGGSRYPLDLLRAAGADLEQPETLDAVGRRFSALVGELRSLLQE
ncbi:MAG: oligoendopeptidase F, partial [Bdellovibrionales bacterium]|nr:oligoendopeptidase F [Bdellovibrionales bacterium]